MTCQHLHHFVDVDQAVRSELLLCAAAWRRSDNNSPAAIMCVMAAIYLQGLSQIWNCFLSVLLRYFYNFRYLQPPTYYQCGLLFQITNTEEGVFSIFRISEHGIKGRKKQKYWLSPRNVTQARPHPVHVDLQLRGAGPPRPSVEPAGFCDVLLYLWLDHRVSVLKIHGSVGFCCQRSYYY